MTNTGKDKRSPAVSGRPFYRIIYRDDGLADVWLTPGRAVPAWEKGKHFDYNIRLYAVQGINPNDSQWSGDLEGHIRENYNSWLESAEEIEI